jgi:hypothetical protein
MGTETLVKRMGDRVHMIFSGKASGGERAWSHIILSEDEWKDFFKEVKDV